MLYIILLGISKKSISVVKKKKPYQIDNEQTNKTYCAFFIKYTLHETRINEIFNGSTF